MLSCLTAQTHKQDHIIKSNSTNNQVQCRQLLKEVIVACEEGGGSQPEGGLGRLGLPPCFLHRPLSPALGLVSSSTLLVMLCYGLLLLAH